MGVKDRGLLRVAEVVPRSKVSLVSFRGAVARVLGRLDERRKFGE